MGILLDVGKANVNAKKNDSSTSLHYAAVHIEAATLLIERGAEINPINEVYYETPLDIMRSIAQPWSPF